VHVVQRHVSESFSTYPNVATFDRDQPSTRTADCLADRALRCDPIVQTVLSAEVECGQSRSSSSYDGLERRHRERTRSHADGKLADELAGSVPGRSTSRDRVGAGEHLARSTRVS